MDRIKQLQSFLQANPQDSFLKHALALEYIKNGDDTTAKTLFEEILTHDAGYIGTYYHLAKLLERTGDTSAAIQWYEKGMEAAQKAGDKHAYGELRSAYEELTF
jgi:Tfp pilus assembly protein PilF